MSNFPKSLPECGHGAEPSTFLFLSFSVGPRHDDQTRRTIEELKKLFAATGTPIRLKTWVSNIYKYDAETRKRDDVLPPEYRLSLGCLGPYKPLAQTSGKLLSANELLAFIANTLKGGTA